MSGDIDGLVLVLKHLMELVTLGSYGTIPSAYT